MPEEEKNTIEKTQDETTVDPVNSNNENEESESQSTDGETIAMDEHDVDATSDDTETIEENIVVEQNHPSLQGFAEWAKKIPNKANADTLDTYQKAFEDLLANYNFDIESQTNPQKLSEERTKLLADPAFALDNSSPHNHLSSPIGKYIEYLTWVDEHTPIIGMTMVVRRKVSSPKIILEKEPSRNIIWFGAPGTGKSYKLNQEKNLLLGGDYTSHYERVTFYADYRYGNFVGSYKPVSYKVAGVNKIKYNFVPGPFLRVYEKAINDPNGKYVLIIEEINRANAASVFGDVFQLLDRNSDGKSEYSINTSEDIKNYFISKGWSESDAETMKIPSNMYIWATMNSADQGVYPLDTAFKRRWDFIYIPIDSNEDDMNGCTIQIAGKETEWNEIRKKINTFLANHNINEDKHLGAHFISKSVFEAGSGTDAFKSKVIMYLFEDAAKQLRRVLFTKNTYSEILKAFDNGEEIFNFDN